MIHLNTHLPKRNENVNEVDDSFGHTFNKEKWRCKRSRRHIWTHTYQREMHLTVYGNRIIHNINLELRKAKHFKY